MTDEQWRQLEWEDNYFSTIEKEYKPPRFDPFLELDPPVSLIKEVIKQLKQQCHGEQNTIRQLKAENFPTQIAEARLAKKVSQIKGYQFRLNQHARTGGWAEGQHVGQISDSDIRRAKEVKIESLYDGRLRKSGRNFVGLCPFHNERGSSFYIYTQDNRWTCFGACGNSGDVIDMVMKLQGLDFISAVKYLNNHAII